MKRRINHVLTVLLILGMLMASFGTGFVSSVEASGEQIKSAALVSGSGFGGFHLISVDQGWVLLNNQLYWTSDGGNTWSLISTSIPRPSNITAIEFIDSNEGRVLMVSSSGGDPIYSLARTHDGGVTWDTLTLSLFLPGDVNAFADDVYMQWLDPQTGWMVVKRATGSNFSIGSLFRTDNGGLTWSQLSIPIGEQVVFITPEVGWVAGGAAGDELYRTMDGGVTWASQAFVQSTGVASQQFAYLLPKFQDVNNGLLPVMFTDGNYVRMDFYSTSDAGQSWNLDNSNPLDGNVDLSVQPPLTLFDASHYFMVVPHSDRIVTELGTQQVTTTYNQDGRSADLTTIDMASMDIGLGLNMNGTCFAQPSYSDEPDPEIKGDLACSQTNQLFKTTDGGQTWNPIQVSGIASDAHPRNSRLSSTNYSNPNASQLFSQNYSYDIMMGQGVDICEIPTASQLQTWWANSPYGAVNLYIGGSLRGCRNSLLNSSLIAQLFQQGWKFIPTWVGPQAPCTSFRSRVSLDPTTAFNQGVTEANAATTAASSLGLTNSDGSNTVIYYDLEAYNTSDSNCRNAMKSFMDGWDKELGVRGNKSGVYGGACSSGLIDFKTIPHVPDAVWLAWWNYTTYNNNASVYGVYCLSDSYWPNHQRLHQYAGSHNETWGDITLNIDNNVLDGLLAVPYQGNPNLAPNQPINPKPIDGGILPRTNDNWLYWSTNGSSCTLHIWGGNMDITPGGNCASLHLGQQAPGSYSWQVTANNSHGSTIGSVWHFNIRPYAPTSLILGTVTRTRIDLGWKLSADDPAYLDGYDVYFNNQYIGSMPKGTVSASISGLACNMSYSIFLRSKRQNVQSTNSNTVTTTTGSCGGATPTTPPPTATPVQSLTPTPTSTNIPGSLRKISPENNTTGVPTSLNLTWGSGSDVSYYLYCYDTINNSNCDRFWIATYSTNATISGLTPGITYYWEIVAVKPSGAIFLDNGTWWSFSLTGNPSTVTPVPSLTASPVIPPTVTQTYTATQTIYAPPQSPTPTATSTIPGGPFGKIDPANSTTGVPGGLMLSWGSVSGVSYYLYCLDTVNNNTCDTSWHMSSSTTAMVSGLISGLTYYWQVVAVKPYEAIFADSGLWWSFSVSGMGPTLTPIPPTATLMPTSTETLTPTATQTIPGATFTPPITATQAGSESSFAKVSPMTGSTGNPSSLVLSWGAVNGASYFLYCFDIINNNNCDTYWTVTALNSVNISGLLPGTTFYWQVLVVKPSGAIFADNGVWWNFMTNR